MAIAVSQPEPTKYRFTVAEYEQLGAAGILGEDDRVELIDGEIIQMSGIGYKHARSVDRLNRRLTITLGEGAIVRIQNPIVVSEHDEPQPDVAVVKPEVEDYASNPLAKDVLLVVEVSDSTLVFDRNVKLPLYARGGIPEAWIVDVFGGVITRYTEPTSQGYTMARSFRRGDMIESMAVPSLDVKVDYFLPE